MLLPKRQGEPWSLPWTVGFTEHVYGPWNHSQCIYGLATALHIAAPGLTNLIGDVPEAQRLRRAGVVLLGRFLSTDFVESSGWPLKSSDLLLPLQDGDDFNGELTLRSPIVSWFGLCEGNRQIRAVDSSYAVWPCTEPLPFPSVRSRSQPLKLGLMGDHAVLAEPLSVLLKGGKDHSALLAVDHRWYGFEWTAVCELLDPFCTPSTTLAGPPSLRLRAFSGDGLLGITQMYREFLAFEEQHFNAEIMVCLYLRDAYFLWSLGQKPTIFYLGFHHSLAWAFGEVTDSSLELSVSIAASHLRELAEHDVIMGGQQRPPTASVAWSLHTGEALLDCCNRRLPAVRPLALHVGALHSYNPNITLGGKHRLLVNCGKPIRMFWQSCVSVWRESRRLLPMSSHLSMVLLPCERDPFLTMGGLSYEDTAKFTAGVFFPWAMGPNTFRELYSIGLPMFVPYRLWWARLWPAQEQSIDFSRLEAKIHPPIFPVLSAVYNTYADMLYWTWFYDDMHQLPGVTTFASIPDLVQVLSMDLDFQKVSNLIVEENKLALVEVGPFWLDLVSRLSSL